jgi:hypothetical protein
MWGQIYPREKAKSPAGWAPESVLMFYTGQKSFNRAEKRSLGRPAIHSPYNVYAIPSSYIV